MEKTGSAGLPWSVPVAVADIPDSGLHIKIDAPPAARAELAELAAVRDVPRLTAEFDLTRRGAKVHVAGHVNAVVEQTCVVTLEPIENEVKEPVDVVFAPPADGAAKPQAALAAEVDVELPDPPDPLIDGKVDLGAVATEFLVLAIDPYPRKAGAAFAPPKVDDAGAHPFAALAALKKPDSGGQS
jgi:uncharacterized metal-binding protein YceD (DUF177 family)